MNPVERFIGWMVRAAYLCRLKTAEIRLSSDLSVLNIYLRATEKLLGEPITDRQNRPYLLRIWDAVAYRQDQIRKLQRMLRALQTKAKTGEIAEEPLTQLEAVRKELELNGSPFK